MRFAIQQLFCLFFLPLFPSHQLPEATMDTASYPADVVTSWLTMQLRLTRTTPASPTALSRRFAYTGIALYESIVPGLAGYQSIAPQLNGLPTLPTVMPRAGYYWPACANAALAAMNRNFYPTTSAANKAAIDSLEAVNTSLYQKDRPADELTRSVDFGRKIATAVFEWAKSDGNDINTPYTLPVGAGLWVPTSPAFMPAGTPNWGQCRLIVRGSDAGVDQPVPIAYSEEPASAYYAQASEVYAISQQLTPEQKTIALFWADQPDGKSYVSGHWPSILNQVLTAQKSTLGVAAVAFAQLGIALSETAIEIMKGKYKYNTVRPITYIQNVMNHPDWKAVVVTPPNPEYPSGHALSSGAAAETLSLLFGAHYRFTDNSYNFLGFTPRAYQSFEEAAREASVSRVYGGIHYRKSCDVSREQGQRMARNIAQRITFKR